MLVAPGDPLWVDVWVPRGDPLFCDDVSRAAHWVGAWWARALDRHLGGRGRLEVHPGPPRGGPGCDLACFAGLGPGEVSFEGAKVVGVAQWRSATGALFHCAAYGTWLLGDLARLLRVERPRRKELAAAWAQAAAGLGDLEGLFELLVEELPGPGWDVADGDLEVAAAAGVAPAGSRR